MLKNEEKCEIFSALWITMYCNQNAVFVYKFEINGAFRMAQRDDLQRIKVNAQWEVKTVIFEKFWINRKNGFELTINWKFYHHHKMVIAESSCFRKMHFGEKNVKKCNNTENLIFPLFSYVTCINSLWKWVSIFCPYIFVTINFFRLHES